MNASKGYKDRAMTSITIPRSQIGHAPTTLAFRAPPTALDWHALDQATPPDDLDVLVLAHHGWGVARWCAEDDLVTICWSSVPNLGPLTHFAMI
jgi:hypothetical protein